MDAGYCGKILRVNLTDGRLTDESLDESLTDKFIGGAGIASKVLFDEVPPEAAPLGSQNKLILMTGPLAGTAVPAGSRFEAVFKSPQTNGYGEANSGGYWGAMLKWAGYDGIIIEGIAKSPKVLVITNDRAYLRDAGHLWGQDTLETENLLRQELGNNRYSFLSIEPAGENLVMFSALINDGGRAAARTGPGAVMGSKKLKAIAVHGNKRPKVADPVRIKELNRGFLQRIRESKGMQGLSANGTIGSFLSWEQKGYGLVRNWQVDLCEWPEKVNISGPVLNEKYLVAKDACYACPIGCGRVVQHPLDGSSVHGPEYETTAMLGAQCCLSNMDGLILANHLCNTLGLDTISTGATIAFAMECYERGLIPDDILEGQKVLWGDKEIILKLIQDIAYKRSKLGELLSSGVKHVAEVLGNDAADFAPQVKSVEAAAHDPRACQCWDLSYATGSAGARHSEAPVWPEFQSLPVPHIGLGETLDRKTTEGKPSAVKLVQDVIASATNSCGCCNLLYGGTDSTDYVLNYLEAVTGRKRSLEELLLCGERSFSVKKTFNLRAGIGRKDDVLPKRFTQDALKAGVSQGLVARTEEMLEEYYQLRGWDPQTGWPNKQKLEELSLPDVSKTLYG